MTFILYSSIWNFTFVSVGYISMWHLLLSIAVVHFCWQIKPWSCSLHFPVAFLTEVVPS